MIQSLTDTQISQTGNGHSIVQRLYGAVDRPHPWYEPHTPRLQTHRHLQLRLVMTLLLLFAALGKAEPLISTAARQIWPWPMTFTLTPDLWPWHESKAKQGRRSNGLASLESGTHLEQPPPRCCPGGSTGRLRSDWLIEATINSNKGALPIRPPLFRSFKLRTRAFQWYMPCLYRAKYGLSYTVGKLLTSTFQIRALPGRTAPLLGKLRYIYINVGTRGVYSISFSSKTVDTLAQFLVKIGIFGQNHWVKIDFLEILAVYSICM